MNRVYIVYCFYDTTNLLNAFSNELAAKQYIKDLVKNKNYVENTLYIKSMNVYNSIT